MLRPDARRAPRVPFRDHRTVKIAVVGAGAMGSVYAGLLGSAGNEVWAVDLWREHIEAIRDHGLRVEGASGDRVVPLRATTDPARSGFAGDGCRVWVRAEACPAVRSTDAREARRGIGR